MTNPTYTTEEIKAAMIEGFKVSPTLAACTYTWAFRSRAKVSAAIRALHAEGKITLAYKSVAGTNVWKLA